MNTDSLSGTPAPGPGRRAALPPADFTAPPTRDPLDGLLVHHRDRDGHERVFDFSTLPGAEPLRRSLAALFATRSARWGSLGAADGMFRYLKAFTTFADQRAHPPRDLHQVNTALVKAGWQQQKHTWGGRDAFQAVASLLREDERLQSGPVLEELARRVPQLPAVRESYAPGEFERIRIEARRAFRVALLRIEENADHLDRWRAGVFEPDSEQWALGEALEVLTRSGDVPRTAGGHRQHRYLRALAEARR
ncbi:hypothetical protein ACGFZP_16490 [Kitasatospora sp. NPDC048239]|uniref:hypothetical protein n=1 Tax=Kitasatospora sp. NPDC048239 TaxID=3364046 RepID=UPI0037156F84